MEDQVALYRTSPRRRWRAKPPAHRRLNDLSPAVGLLELSNALDFAANVWNAIPPPVISMTFMALGGTGALIILAFALVDIPRTRRNIKLLRDERRRVLQLHTDTELASSNGMSNQDTQVYLDMNQRELGNEVIDRLGMGLLLGFGAVTVGIGTYLAIDGANPTSFLASNVITGYVGNVPAALYGLTNATWCIYGWRRAQRHANAAAIAVRNSPGTGRSEEIAEQIERHSKRVKLHASINGITGILGGAGSLMTASAYIHPIGVWGYVILAPCAISAFGINIYWRLRVNYDRDIVEPTPVNHDKLLNDTEFALARENLLYDYRQASHVKGSSERSKEPIDRSSLRGLLIGYYTAMVKWLTKDLDRLSKDLETCHSNESSKEDGINDHTTELAAQLEKARRQIDQSQESLRRLQPEEQSSEKALLNDDLLNAVYEVLVIEDLFPQLLVRIANDSDMTVLLGKDLNDSKELHVNAAHLWQRLAEDEGLRQRAIKIAGDVLADDGAKLARSRIRMYCELCGCAFGRAP